MRGVPSRQRPLTPPTGNPRPATATGTSNRLQRRIPPSSSLRHHHLSRTSHASHQARGWRFRADSWKAIVVATAAITTDSCGAESDRERPTNAAFYEPAPQLRSELAKLMTITPRHWDDVMETEAQCLTQKMRLRRAARALAAERRARPHATMRTPMSLSSRGRRPIRVR